MSIHTDPNAAHAIYAPSSAHRWAMENGCSASAEAIAHLGEQEEGEEAQEGTAAHDEIERCLYVANAEEAHEVPRVPDPEHPAAYGVALLLDYVRQLPPGQMWVEQRVALTPQIWGRCDVAHWHAESKTLTIVDYKNGFVGVDAEKNEQLRIYAAASIFTHKLPAVWIRYAVVQPNDFRPVPRVKQWGEDFKSLLSFAERVAAIPAGPKKFVAGEQCTYCPLFGRCEASKDVLRQLAPFIAGLASPEAVPLAQRAIFSACEKPIADLFKASDKVWTKEALTGKVPDGMVLVTAQTRRAWKDENAAREYVLKEKGVAALSPPTPAQAEKLGLDLGDMAPAPPGGPVLAMAGDKRKPWAPKSAAEMFASVTGPKP